MYDTGPGEVRRIGSVEQTDPESMGRVSVFGSKISWGAVVAGTIVALSVGIGLNLLAAWAGFGLHDVTSLSDLSSRATGAGVWITISSIIAIFVGGLVAAVMAGSFTSMNGLYHGLIVWGVTVVSSIGLTTFGVTGMLGFGITSRSLLNSLPGVTGSSLSTASSISSTYAGWFLLAFVLSFVGGVAGGWVGSMTTSRREMVAGRSYESAEERRAA